MTGDGGGLTPDEYARWYENRADRYEDALRVITQVEDPASLPYKIAMAALAHPCAASE